MPNWFDDSVRVTGKEGNVERFYREFLKKGFEACLPVPNELLDDPIDE